MESQNVPAENDQLRALQERALELLAILRDPSLRPEFERLMAEARRRSSLALVAQQEESSNDTTTAETQMTEEKDGGGKKNGSSIWAAF